MKTYKAVILSLAIAISLPSMTHITPAHAKSCLGHAQQHKAIKSGKVKRFGVVAKVVSQRLNATVVNGQLCKRGGRLVYILSVINQHGQTRRAIVDAKSGR